MRGFIEEYGQIMLVVAIVLLLLLFGKTGFASDVKTLFVNQVASTIAENPNNDKQIVMVRYEKRTGLLQNTRRLNQLKRMTVRLSHGVLLQQMPFKLRV